MALETWIMLGLAGCAGYIGLHYGADIMANLKAGVAPQQAPSPAQTPASTTDGDTTTPAPTPTPTATSPAATPTTSGAIHRHPAHPNASKYQPGAPGALKPNVHCVCVQDILRGPGCNAVGRDCSLKGFESNQSYWSGYNVPVEGPEYYRTIPHYLSANAGRVVMPMPMTRIGMFMPSGFVLREANIQRDGDARHI